MDQLTHAVILAGGKATRLGSAGRLLPKPLIYIFDTPVINRLVDKLLACEIERIYILTKKTQLLEKFGPDNPRDLYLQKNFEDWKAIWYGDNKKIELVF